MAFKLFPAQLTPDKRKVPLIKDWQTLATDDPQQLQLWNELHREKLAFWGMPAGPENGILVLDVDVKPGQVSGFETIQKLNLQIPDTLQQRTPSGGRHYFFKYPQDGKHHGNRVKFLPGLDTRGAGGWVAYYGEDIDWSKPLANAPDWLLDETGQKLQVQPPATIKVVPEIANAIINASLEAIREAPQGESNDTLNRESFKVGQLVASGSISREFAFDALFKAAKERGKPDYEARATITSGLDGGGSKPLTSPFSTEQPVPHFTIPAAPEPQGRWTPSKFTRFDLLDTTKLRKPQIFEHWSSEDITLTTADGGTGKTTLALYESVCLALGERFLGFDSRQSGRTIYITGEDTDKKLGAVLGAIMRQMGLWENTPENAIKVEKILDSIVIKKDSDLCLISKDKQNFLHPNGEAMRKLLEAVDDIKPKRIVFDPIASFWGSEAALNDMNKAVTKFAAELVERSGAQVEMINHMGKSSSNSKDMTQFAGRGGTGLPSNSRIVRAYRTLKEDEYKDLTGEDLGEKQSAMEVCISKYSDGTPLLNKNFVVVRDGYLFHRKFLTPQKQKDLEVAAADTERVFTFVKEERRCNRYPTKGYLFAHFAATLSKARIEAAISILGYTGHMGEIVKLVDNPDQSTGGKVFIIVDHDGKEL